MKIFMLREIRPFILTQAENPNSKDLIRVVEIPVWCHPFMGRWFIQLLLRGKRVRIMQSISKPEHCIYGYFLSALKKQLSELARRRRGKREKPSRRKKTLWRNRWTRRERGEQLVMPRCWTYTLFFRLIFHFSLTVLEIATNYSSLSLDYAVENMPLDRSCLPICKITTILISLSVCGKS